MAVPTQISAFFSRSQPKLAQKFSGSMIQNGNPFDAFQRAAGAAGSNMINFTDNRANKPTVDTMGNGLPSPGNPTLESQRQTTDRPVSSFGWRSMSRRIFGVR